MTQKFAADPGDGNVEDAPAANLAGGAAARLDLRRPTNRFERFVARYYPPILVLMILSAAVILDQAYRKMTANPYDKGMAHFFSQKYDAAIADFQKALRQNPSDIASQFELGYAYHQKGWLDEALKEYEVAGPRSLQTAHYTYHNSGVILQNKGRLDLAAAAYQSSLRANPSAANSLLNLLLIYESKNEYDKALRACQAYLEATPKDAAYFFKAGQIAEKLNRRDLALRYYRDALALDANFSQAKARLKILSAKQVPPI